jgi:hypothetical protein
VTDGYEHAWLVSPECEGGIAPWSSDATDQHADVKAFNEVFVAQKPGIPHKSIKATFTGRFVYDAATHNPSNRKKFEILKVDDLDVSANSPE